MRIKKILYNIVKSVLPVSLLLYRGRNTSKKIALTFDDGPYSGNTENILKILRKNDVKATFFMSGTKIEQHRKLFLKVVAEGQEIGNHLHSHKPVTELTYRELDREVLRWEDIVNQIIRISSFPKLLRPPYGRVDLNSLWYAWRHHWTIVLWSIDTGDLKGLSLEDNIRALESVPINGGDIVLLHDDATHIERLLEWIIEWVKSKDFTFCKVSEIFM